MNDEMVWCLRPASEYHSRGGRGHRQEWPQLQIVEVPWYLQWNLPNNSTFARLRSPHENMRIIHIQNVTCSYSSRSHPPPSHGLPADLPASVLALSRSPLTTLPHQSELLKHSRSFPSARVLEGSSPCLDCVAPLWPRLLPLSLSSAPPVPLCYQDRSENSPVWPVRLQWCDLCLPFQGPQPNPQALGTAQIHHGSFVLITLTWTWHLWWSPSSIPRL